MRRLRSLAFEASLVKAMLTVCVPAEVAMGTV